MTTEQPGASPALSDQLGLEPERAAFEAWAIEEGFAWRSCYGFWFYRNGGDGLFEAWQGGRAAERERWRAAMRMKHDYQGGCPDDQQPESRDPECSACRALLELEA